MGEPMMLYRAAWIATQEDGGRAILRGVEFKALDKAIQERNDANRADYVTEAWLERAEWQRFDPSPPAAGDDPLCPRCGTPVRLWVDLNKEAQADCPTCEWATPGPRL